MNEVVMCYLIAVNLITLAVYIIDKIKARRHAWRISEAALLLWAVAGGSIGALVGIFIVRHKSQHLKFRYGVPAIFIFQTALAIYAYSRWL